MNLNPLRPGRSIEHSSVDEFGFSGWHGQTKKLVKGKPCKRCTTPFDQKSANGDYCSNECRRLVKLEQTRKSNERAKRKAKGRVA